LAAEHIDMPLDQFFLYITIGLLSMLIIILLIAPLSLSKLTAIVGLYITSIITSLLTYGNYQINKMKDVDILIKTILASVKGESEFASSTNEAFIA
jgi:hypothetical protein